SFKQNSKIALLLNNIELSVLESLHYTCILSIDETTDRFISYLISVDDEIIYVWKKHKGRKLGSIKVKRTFVIETMEACIQQIESDYPHLAYSGKIS
ncbi:MAG TPA: hypothetical protein VGE24_09670, partial [Emticicia sp.]